MQDQIRTAVLSQVGDPSGWGELVDSMSGALNDRSHATGLGYALVVVVFIWINWRIARWMLGRVLTPKRV